MPSAGHPLGAHVRSGTKLTLVVTLADVLERGLPWKGTPAHVLVEIAGGVSEAICESPRNDGEVAEQLVFRNSAIDVSFFVLAQIAEARVASRLFRWLAHNDSNR
jgi:hypothetical protein